MAVHVRLVTVLVSKHTVPEETSTPTRSASSAGSYTYPASIPIIDPATAVLGHQWNDLRAGDTVNVKVIDTPTNSIIFDKDILVTEG